MNINAIIIIILLALLYLGTQGAGIHAAGNAQITPPQRNACVEALQAQYADQWPTMSAPERAAIGLRAAACE
jgi:hypothetical protein